MPLETLDRSPPPLFNQGPSAFTRLVFFGTLALLLMTADARWRVVQPLRAAVAAVLYPVQWLALQPVQAMQEGMGYLTDLKTARKTEEATRRELAAQSQRAGQGDLLLLENERLRRLLDLRQRLPVEAAAAQVLYDATDPFSRRVVIDKGQIHGIEPASPVMDEAGVLGQVTRVYPFVSEITLLVDRDQVIPVINARTGQRSVAYGAAALRANLLELRYLPVTEDVRAGDELLTSGIDGVYPPGLPVATVASVQKSGNSGFARVQCAPLAQMQGVIYVMVLQPVTGQRRLAGMQAPASDAAALAPAAAAAQAVEAAQAASHPAQTASRPAPRPARARRAAGARP
ncbi:MAG: rod shape-determining protein MreC [Burkholderiaceae bacterium]|jgi:rod shape-determining protein MreC|nr:rod shape-determining protein MreC [Burkholderiaceae bacterium]